MGSVTDALHTCYFIATGLMWAAATIHLIYNLCVKAPTLSPPPLPATNATVK